MDEIDFTKEVTVTGFVDCVCGVDRAAVAEADAALAALAGNPTAAHALALAAVPPEVRVWYALREGSTALNTRMTFAEMVRADAIRRTLEAAPDQADVNCTFKRPGLKYFDPAFNVARAAVLMEQVDSSTQIRRERRERDDERFPYAMIQEIEAAVEEAFWERCVSLLRELVAMEE